MYAYTAQIDSRFFFRPKYLSIRNLKILNEIWQMYNCIFYIIYLYNFFIDKEKRLCLFYLLYLLYLILFPKLSRVHRM